MSLFTKHTAKFTLSKYPGFFLAWWWYTDIFEMDVQWQVNTVLGLILRSLLNTPRHNNNQPNIP